MIRVRVPTVLSRGERPFVELAFEEQAFRLSSKEAQSAQDWMAWAGAWLSSAPALELGGAIERARDALASEPPRPIDDHPLGALKGQLSSGEPAWLELSVQTCVRAPGHPRIQLAIGESLAVDEEPFYGDTWWIDAREAAELALLLRAGAGSVGDFLHVRAALDPEHGRRDGIELRFADRLMEESDDDGVFWLATRDARRVGDWLDAAVRFARDNPPHVFRAPEPDPVTIAEIAATLTGPDPIPRTG